MAMNEEFSLLVPFVSDNASAIHFLRVIFHSVSKPIFGKFTGNKNISYSFYAFFIERSR